MVRGTAIAWVKQPVCLRCCMHIRLLTDTVCNVIRLQCTAVSAALDRPVSLLNDHESLLYLESPMTPVSSWRCDRDQRPIEASPTVYTVTRWLGGLLVERRTSVSQIRGSIPGQLAAV